MKTLISNKITVIKPTNQLYNWCVENLIIVNPKWQTLVRLGKEDQITRFHISKDMELFVEYGFRDKLVLPFGVLYAIWPMIKDYEYEISLNDNGIVIDKDMKITMPLFDYQEEAVCAMLKAKGGILEAAAGSGKTNCGIEIIKRIGRNALWLCHTGDLLRQTVDRIHLLYPDMPVGTITEGKMEFVTNGITVSTIQTLVTIDSDYYKDVFDVIVCDECHRVSGSPRIQKMFAKIIEKVPARYKFGLSATPERSDTMGKTMYTLIGGNVLGEFEPVFTIDKSKTNTLQATHVRVDLDTPWSYECLNEDGTFNYMTLLDVLGRNEERNLAIVEHVVKSLDVHKKQLVLCQRIEQCELIHNMLLEKGVASVLLVGKVTKKKRVEILNRLVDYNVIVGSYALAKEGLDLKELSCLHWAMLTSNKTDAIQSVGRIERVCEGKPQPVVYDYVDKNYPYCVGKYKKRVSWLKRR